MPGISRHQEVVEKQVHYGDEGNKYTESFPQITVAQESPESFNETWFLCLRHGCRVSEESVSESGHGIRWS